MSGSNEFIFKFLLLLLDFSMIFFVIGIVVKAIQILAYLQQKNYRLDRLGTFIFYEQGSREIFGKRFFGEIILYVAFLLTYEPIFLIFLAFWSFIFLLHTIIQHDFRRPLWTMKSATFLFLQLLINIAIIDMTSFLSIIFLFLFQPLLSLLCLLLLIPFNSLLKKYILEKAYIKRKSLKHIRVIGITGSFGKTSTKEFVQQILEKRYKVISTPKNINSEIGIANFFLDKIDDSYDYFVIEMGAYRKGEIALLCDAFQPQIGILTGINAQHIGLFGSQENIITAKFELIDHLPADGIALLNMTSPLVAKEWKRREKSHCLSFGYELSRSSCQSIIGLDTKTQGKAELTKNGETLAGYTFHAPYEKFFINLIPALFLGYHLKISQDDIQAALNAIKIPEGILKRIALPYGGILWDDSYNSNPDGFLNALNTLAVESEGEKIIVTPGIFELGEYGHEINRQLFEKIDTVAHAVVFTKKFMKKYVDSYQWKHILKKNIFISESSIAIIRWLELRKTPQSVFLAEGRLKNDLLTYLKQTAVKVSPFRLFSCSLSPNTDRAYLITCLKYLFSPWYWNEWHYGSATSQLVARLKVMFSWQDVFLFDSGRSAIFATLTVLGVGNGDEVITQAFSCSVISNAILSCGAKPVYVDIKGKTLNMNVDELKLRITEKTKAVIVQHTFGIPADIENIQKICREKRIKLIESLAHSFGNKTENGFVLGTFSDAAVLSFGRDKIISSIEGGGVGFPTNEYTEKMKKVTTSLKPFPTRRIAQDLLHPLIASIATRWYFFGSLGKGIFFLAQKVSLINKVLTNSEKKGRSAPVQFSYPNILAKLYLQQLSFHLSFQSHREMIAHIYKEILKRSNGMKWMESSQPYLRFPLIAHDSDGMKACMRKYHIDLGDWYNPVISGWEMEIMKKYYVPGSCPVAEDISSKIINLPTHRNITFSDAIYIANTLKSCCHESYVRTS
jgi:UDP-N-acetylmuramoyl-tripeptide--D-alanyl-D-alanine ligase